jgi:hypothetical protein
VEGRDVWLLREVSIIDKLFGRKLGRLSSSSEGDSKEQRQRKEGDWLSSENKLLGELLFIKD